MANSQTMEYIRKKLLCLQELEPLTLRHDMSYVQGAQIALEYITDPALLVQLQVKIFFGQS
jgi:hypothetical protein